eukprot:11666541-Prorocentrum_lima.AAC.1
MDTLANSNIHKQTKELRYVRRQVHRAISLGHLTPPQPPPPSSHRGGNWTSSGYQYPSGSFCG